jgi:hypothetical protein
MAVLHSVQDLQECSLDKIIIANILALLGDVREQITFWAVFDYNIGAIWSVHNFHQGYYIGMSAGLVMELDLSLLELPLARLKSDLVEGLYSIRYVRLNIHSRVNNSIGSDSEDTCKLKSSSKYLA